ncbi:carbohydrate ABC transporter permease [Erysipelothrix rhusiopathiae]|uniref:carbohydrate ABC transporter permease n=1 Tax=Erysipelothrix rhusiopathiae TaxID=1648 RepID=UPI000210B443|nr:carbohydrate ABC transporter permease [Erysipelothrix rhusiopathiae]AGN25231.1 sugar ABC transporter permease [Erysipelothrix rhusiopathiae SY1027]AMS11750.1 sugar ABC transporter permease [Erysipelothrix rhusiopathiae]AOO68250.1 sugar ABC transporter permease [Erysipelothrix rhusiopathiae]AWU40901.1 carbohydrate ABC transporter permease [Erysipelothrix rhusiopathiae]MCG4435882.1 carbohydrate ABC transporter permease [Erysipelothrix rhusiopathiae]
MKKKKIEKVEVRSFSKNTDRVFNVIIGLFALSCIFPFIFVIVVSFTTETALMVNGYTLFPKEVSLDGYKFLYDFKGQLLNSFGVTVFITVVGTLINTTFTSTYAYAISRPNFKYRRFFTKFALLTMLFSAGMIPNYIVMTKLLGLKDTIWALILPMALSPFNIIVMRTFFKRTVPDAIIESARIDGASEFRIFIQIVLPLAVPGIATISLFAALAFWNDWFNALLYINSENLYPLQYLLMKIQSNLDYISQNVGLSGINSGIGLPKESARMAMVVLSTLPIAVSYPFFQKYFVSGLTIGGVKE